MSIKSRLAKLEKQAGTSGQWEHLSEARDGLASVLVKLDLPPDLVTLPDDYRPTYPVQSAAPEIERRLRELGT